ncbi:HlyD family efflux transporter periplasmic adaptor subunit [Candidatus Kaiserbacteria bacterium]|nr:HlyD family efflux transporter periplasmic adaptor subunit [Candidatus Kaiserbacteria bacterium]
MQERSFISVLIGHKAILIALGVVVSIAAVSGFYYVSQTKRPAEVALPSAADHFLQTIVVPGTVEPLQNPNLSFATVGRITYVGVKVGDRVYGGQTLASLDVGALVAQRAQAEADEKAQEAKLDALKSGPRSTDLAVRESAVAQATQSRANTYAALPSGLSDAYAKAVDAVKSQSDNVFSNPNTSSPVLIFNTTDSNAGNAAVAGRVTAGGELGTWNAELAALPANPSEGDLDSALNKAITHLSVIRSFEDSLVRALDYAIPTTGFSSASLSTAETAVSAARTSVNGLITSLTNTKQVLVSQALAIESAQVELDQLKAGASVQDIAVQEAAVERAKAVVSAVSAQIANNIISAPFSGTVGSVSTKAGELATPNVPAITVVPDSALEVVVYVTELDVTRIKKGDVASVTLDAYGSDPVFPAHISEVDAAPSSVNGVAAYKVTLVFDTPDAAVKTGMTANTTITPSAQ